MAPTPTPASPSTPEAGAPVRPTPAQVLDLAGGPPAATAALTCADPAMWSAAGHDDGAVWGRYLASSAEPYEVIVDLTGPAFRCTCPSRRVPCKHALGLLLLHADHAVVPANRLPFADRWLRMRRPAVAPAPHDRPPPDAAGGPDPATGGVEAAAGPSAHGDGARSAPAKPADRDRRLHERAERMRHGLRELDRWLGDRVRAGLAAPELADREEWERLAARLVDAQCGGLANRVKRVAGRIGQHPRWYEDVLEEMAVLHALAVGAQRTSLLPPELADGVHVATGLTTAKDDVLAGVPDTDRWVVAGESRVREDRITVQRTWLQAAGDVPGAARWAMLLSFGAVGNEVASPYPIGAELVADVHWYPGGVRLRALVGRVHDGPSGESVAPVALSLGDGVAAAGRAVAAEPWLERHPMCAETVPTRTGGGRWVLADATGAVPIVPGYPRLPELLSLSGGHPVRLVGEWGLDGFLPLVAWDGDRAVVL